MCKMWAGDRGDVLLCGFLLIFLVCGPILVVGTHPRVVCARLCGFGIGFLGHRSPPGADIHHKIQACFVDRVFREYRNGD